MGSDLQDDYFFTTQQVLDILKIKKSSFYAQRKAGTLPLKPCGMVRGRYSAAEVRTLACQITGQHPDAETEQKLRQESLTDRLQQRMKELYGNSEDAISTN